MNAAPAHTPLGELIQALSEGLARPLHAWQAVAIGAGIALAWILARLGARLLAQRQAREQARAPQGAAAGGLRALDLRSMPASIAGARRVLFPVLAWLLLWIGAALLRARHLVASVGEARLMHLAMSLLGALAVVRLLFAGLRRVLRNSPLTTTLERVIGAAAILAVALYATGVWDDVVEWLAATAIPLGANARVSLWSILVGSATTLLALLVAMWLGSLIEDRLAEQTALEPNLRLVLGRVARALLLTVALLLALALSGIDLTVLSVFGGALGVGLGLGLQRIASNYVSGFILLLDRSLRIGDLVGVDKYYGQVTQISTRYTVLRALDGTEAVVPNEMLVSAPVVNYTLGNRRLGLSVHLAVGPEADLALLAPRLAAAARSVPRVLAEPAPVVLLKDLQSGNLLLELSFWIADPENGRSSAQSEVAMAALAALRELGIPLAPPRGDLVVQSSRILETQER